MEINWGDVARALAAGLPAFATIAGLAKGPGRRRARLRRDVEVLGNLPEGSSAHSAMLGWIEHQISELRRFESTATRDWLGLVVAILLSILFGFVTYYLFAEGAWWQLVLGTVAGTITAALIYTIFDRAQLAERDKQGNRVESASS